MPEWEFVEYGSLAAQDGASFAMGPFGSRLTQRDYRDSGVPLTRGINLARGRFYDDDFVFISPDKADEVSSANVGPGDLIFTHRGTIGQVSMIPRRPRFDRYVICSSQVKTRLDQSLTVPEFYYYWFQSTEGQRSILANSSTVGVPGIATPLTSIRRLRVPLPCLDIQKAVSAVLGALDDKIASNELLIETCDNLRSLGFARYVQSREDGATKPLSSVAKFINGRAFTKDATGRGKMVIRIAEINSGPGRSTVYNDIEVPDQHRARPGDILFAWSGSLVVARWFRPEAIINQHIFKVIPETRFPKWLVFELTKSKLDEFKRIAADKATTMGHIQRRHLDEPVVVPAAADIHKLDAEFGALWDRALIAEQENLALAELRDTFLPRLMSGELRVKDAEKVVEDAT